MRAYSLTHLGDAALTRDLATVISRERTATAIVLAHIAEFDARRLDRKSTRLNSSHIQKSRMPSSA